MDFLNGGELFWHLRKDMKFSEKRARLYAAEIVCAIETLHANGIIYRDLKPENIMLDDKGYLRVIDFGFSKRVPYTKTEASGEVKVFNKTYTLCGTPGTVFAKVSFY